jgi:hypothetical protein
MVAFRKLLQLGNDDRWLLLQAFTAVARASVAVRLLPASIVLKKLAEDVPLLRQRQPRSAERVAWAVTAAARYIPGSKCLVQAIAGRSLLAKCGIHSQIRIGVAKDSKNWLSAHAWVEVEGKTLIGGDTAVYAPLVGSNVDCTP